MSTHNLDVLVTAHTHTNTHTHIFYAGKKSHDIKALRNI